MGSNDRLSDSSQRIRTTVCGVHPGFKTDGPIMYYDIAFCQLKTPIILDDPRVSKIVLFQAFSLSTFNYLQSVSYRYSQLYNTQIILNF